MHMTKQTWSVEEIATQIHAIARECSSSHNDGFTAFELKKDLYQIKEILETAIKQSPIFYGEQEWLTEQEKKRIIKILKS